jgi:predicted RNA polymerase sigma factor
VATDTHPAIEAVWRIEAPRLIAGLTGLVGDVGVAEELAQDALVAALEQWPAEGVPRNPGAWLMTTAKRRAIDQIRRNETFKRKVEEVGRELEVVYLIFNEGYSATAGDECMRPALCEEALRLGRILARLAPREPEVHGLVALMEIQASRAAARTGPGGEPILMAD